MRTLLGLLCVCLACAPSARAGDDRPAAIVGAVRGLEPGRKAEITVHRLGGTELMDRHGVELDESVACTLETSADGGFEAAGLVPGVYVLLARQGEARIGETLVAVYAGSRREANVDLESARTLAAVVTWTDGRPVEGVARIRLQRSRGGAYSGPYDPWRRVEEIEPSGPTLEAALVDGAFRIGLTSRRTVITIETAEGHRILWGEAWGTLEEAVAWSVPVPERTLTGRVLDAAGGPVPGAAVVARHRVQGGLLLSTAATSGADGRFTLPVASVPALVTASADGFRRAREPAFEGGDLLVERIPTASVEGRVLHDGKGVGGAVVHVVPGELRIAMPRARRAVSGVDGRYRVDGIPAGRVAVFVRGGGFASVDLDTVGPWGPHPFLLPLAAGGSATRDLPARPAARLEGRVLDHAGTAVVGATIVGLGVTAVRGGYQGFASGLAQSAHVGPFVTTTDAEGRFRLEDLVPGHLLSLRIDAPGRPRLDAVARPAVGGAPVELRFERPRYLTVCVVDGETGVPLAGASVALEERSERGTTGNDGRTRFGPFGEGPVRVRVRAEGFVPVVGVEPEGSAKGAGPFDLTVPLQRGLTIRGRVLDAEGRPVERAHVRALHAVERRSGTAASAVTGAEGAFVLAGLLPGTWEIEVTYVPSPDGPGERRRIRRVRVEVEAGAEDVTLRLEPLPPAPVVALQVHDPDGKAVPRARAVLVVRGMQLARADVVEGAGVLTVGSEAVESVAADEAYVLVAGAADADGAPLPLGDGWAGPVEAGEEAVRVTLPPERRIEGRVLSPEGEAVVGATVRVHRAVPGSPRRYLLRGAPAETDAEGRFVLRHLGPGTHGLEVDAGARFLVAMREVEAGAQGVEIVLVRGRTARVTVIGPEGKPLGGVTLSVGDSTRERRARTRTERAREPRLPHPVRREQRHYESAVDGSVVLVGLEPERAYDLEVYSRRDDVRDARLVDWEPADTEIRLERGIVIAGRVVDDEGAVVEDAVVQVEGQEYLKGTRCTSDGAFRFVRLEPGPHTLRAGRRGMAWDDPRIRTLVVRGEAEDLVVAVGPR